MVPIAHGSAGAEAAGKPDRISWDFLSGRSEIAKNASLSVRSSSLVRKKPPDFHRELKLNSFLRGIMYLADEAEMWLILLILQHRRGLSVFPNYSVVYAWLSPEIASPYRQTRPADHGEPSGPPFQKAQR